MTPQQANASATGLEMRFRVAFVTDKIKIVCQTWMKRILVWEQPSLASGPYWKIRTTHTPSKLRCRNLKRNVTSSVTPTVHTNPSWTRSFSKTVFKAEEFKNIAFAFWRSPKTFSKKTFSITSRCHVTSRPEESQLKWEVIVALSFQFIRRVAWATNIWCVLRVRTPFSNFYGVVTNLRVYYKIITAEGTKENSWPQPLYKCHCFIFPTSNT